MKAIKIVLIVAIVAIIGFFVYKFLGEKPPIINPIELSNNPWIIDIKHDIDSVLPKQTDFHNAHKYYTDIQSRINDNYQNKHLGNNVNDNANNETNKRLLSERLYASYFKQFVEMAFNVFNHSEWKIDDLKFIRDEIKKLQLTSYYDPKDYQGKNVKEINNILAKYDEIDNFISSCKVSSPGTDLSDRFPIEFTVAKISQTNNYLNNHLGIEYINNCTRLKDGLNEIPQNLFNAHVRYLDRKINHWSNMYMYPNYTSQSAFVNNLYNPIKNEIEALNNGIYNTSNFDSELSRLSAKWSAENTKAYNYNYP